MPSALHIIRLATTNRSISGTRSSTDLRLIKTWETARHRGMTLSCYMSAFTPTADMRRRDGHVSFVPINRHRARTLDRVIARKPFLRTFHRAFF